MKVIDLFSGCGGLSLGFKQAGFELVAAVDNWDAANLVYSLNFKNRALNLDLKRYKEYLKLLKDFNSDIIIGGPPCQDFSHAGKRNEDLGNGMLTLNFAEIIKHIRPKFFVMENVDRLIATKKFELATKIFKELEYGVTIALLNSCYYDVPQNRKRYFVFGVREGPDDFLLFYLNKNKSYKQLTVREYLNDFLGIDYYYRHPRTYNRRAIFSIDEPSPTIRGVNRPIPKNYRIHPNDATKDLSKVRPLTTFERSLIQTFPIDFVWVGSKTELEQMIGNAVPVNLAKYVAISIKNYVNDST